VQTLAVRRDPAPAVSYEIDRFGTNLAIGHPGITDHNKRVDPVRDRDLARHLGTRPALRHGQFIH
jgi:hypothetical protein